MPNGGAKLQPPVIMGSAPSSGSTLLVNLIGRVPGIYQRGELSIFDKRDWLKRRPDAESEAWKRGFRRGYRRRLACEMRVAFTNLEPVPLIEEWQGDFFSFACSVMDRLAERDGCRRWVEKSPTNIFAFDVIAGRSPEAKLVFIKRDARAVVASLLKRGFSACQSAALWYLASLLAYRMSLEGTARIVSFEDLVGDPATTCRSLFEQIGERFEDGILSQMSEKTPKLPSWRFSPASAVSADAIRRVEVLSPVVRRAFSRLRPAESFLIEHGFHHAPPPLELQCLLGYPTEGLEASGRGLSVDPIHAADVLRYAAGMARNCMLPRPIPYRFA